MILLELLHEMKVWEKLDLNYKLGSCFHLKSNPTYSLGTL